MKEKMYNSEEEFLKHYNPDDFERLSATVDILITSVSDTPTQNYRKLNKKASLFYWLRGILFHSKINGVYPEDSLI